MEEEEEEEEEEKRRRDDVDGAQVGRRFIDRRRIGRRPTAKATRRRRRRRRPAPSVADAAPSSLHRRFFAFHSSFSPLLVRSFATAALLRSFSFVLLFTSLHSSVDSVETSLLAELDCLVSDSFF